MSESDNHPSTAGTIALSAHASHVGDELEMEDRGGGANASLLLRGYEESTDFEDTLNVVSLSCLTCQLLLSSESIPSCDHRSSFIPSTRHHLI